jgi:hypothetical protein
MARLQTKGEASKALSEAVQTAAQGAKDLDAEAQVEAMRTLSLPDQPTTDTLWLIFVPGLLVLAVLLAVFVFILIQDDKATTDPALLSQTLTFVLGSVVGLFVPSPASKAGQR